MNEFNSSKSKSIHADRPRPAPGETTPRVTSLADERRKRRPDDTCELCARRDDGAPCTRHRLEALVDRVRKADVPESLLVPAWELTALRADALAVVNSVLDDYRQFDRRYAAQ